MSLQPRFQSIEYKSLVNDLEPIIIEIEIPLYEITIFLQILCFRNRPQNVMIKTSDKILSVLRFSEATP